MRIAIATVGTTGDVVPFAALAAGLVSAGHDVTAISWELHREALSGSGARFAAAGPRTTWDEIRDTARRAAAARNPQQQVAVLRDFHLRDAAEHYRQLRDLLGGQDLVLLHGIHSLAEAAARDIGARYATAVFDPVLLPTRERPPAGMPSLGPLNGAAWWLLDRMLARLGRPLESALRQAGSQAAGAVRLFRARSPLLHLVACSPVLAGEPADLPEQVTFTGAWVPATVPSPLPADIEAFLAAGDPPVVVSFGSMATDDPVGLARAISAALRDAGLRGIVQAGSAGLRAAAHDQLLTVGAVDHRSLFPRAAVIVHHGGAGTSHAAAAAGVPSVVLPHVGDQLFWADRLHRLSAAPPPLSPRTPDASRLAERLRQAVASPAIAAGARALAELMRTENGVATAIRRLEAAAQSAPPS